jgi:hypothetical protein
MSQNSIDYFATLGRKEGQLTCKHLLPIGADSDEQNLTVHPSEVWGDAITDIEVIYKGWFANVSNVKSNCVLIVPLMFLFSQMKEKVYEIRLGS